MNEDFLKALHANMGGDAVGSFDEFKNEFQSNKEFQRAVHKNIGGDKVGSFDEFKIELFGAPAATFNQQPPAGITPNDAPKAVSLEEYQRTMKTQTDALKSTTARLKGAKTQPKETTYQIPTTSGHGALLKTEELIKPIKDRQAEIEGNFLTQTGDYLSDVGAGLAGLFKYGTVTSGYSVSQRERNRQKELQSNKLQEDKKALLQQLPAEGIPAVSIKDAVELELASPKSMSTPSGTAIVTMPSAEEAHRKGTLRIKEHTELLKDLAATRRSSLTKEEVSIVDNMNSLDPEFLKSYQMSDNMKSYILAQKNLNDQIGLNEETFSKYDPLIEESYKAILNARQNGSDPKQAFNDAIDKYSSENPEDDAAIKTIKAKIGMAFDVAEPIVGVPVAEQVQETAYGLGKTAGALIDFTKDYFGAATRTFSPNTKFDKQLLKDLGTDEARGKIRDIIVNNPNDASTSDLIESLVKIGDRTLVLKNGKVDKIRDKEGKQVYYPTKQDAQIIEQFGKNPDKYEVEKDVNFSAGWQQGVQVLTDMVPMIAAASATGGGSMGMMLGSAAVSYGDYYEQALAEMGDISKSSLYAAATAGAIGYVESKIGKAEALFGRAFTGAEKSAIIRSIEEVAKKESSKGVMASTLERGFMQKVKEVVVSGQPILKEVPLEVIEELTNFPVEGLTAATFDMPYDSPGEAEVINTIGLTTLVTTLMGGIGGVASSNRENLNSLISLGVNNRDGFKEVADAWVQSARDKNLPEEEISRRQKEVEKKSKLIETVGKYYDFIKEESEDRKISDEKKNSIMELAQEKAMLDYKADGSTSTIRKDKIAAEAAEVQKKLDKLVYSGTDIAEPILDSDEDIKQKEEAAAQKKKDKEKQKTQEDAIQEQKATEVPVQPEATGSGADTQGQPQPESQGTTQQGQAQEQVQGEEVKTDRTSIEDKTEDILDEVTDEKVGERKYKSFNINLQDGARAYGRIDDGVASIVGIEAAKIGDGIERAKGTKVYERVLNSLSENGVKTIKVGNQSIASRKALSKLVEAGILTNPREMVGVSVDEHPSKFDINPEAPKATKKPEPTLTATEAEKVAPTPTAEAQTANVEPITKKDLKSLTQDRQNEIYESLPQDAKDKHFRYGVSGVNSKTPAKFYTALKNAVGEEAAANLVRGEAQPTSAPTPTEQTPTTEQVFTYPSGKTTPAVKKDGKWFLPETGALNEDGKYKGTFANEKQSKQLDMIYSDTKTTSYKGVKYADIVVGDKYLEDILSDNKLSENEKQEVREVFDVVGYFKFDKSGEQKFQEKFANPEDITEIADILTGVSAAQQSAFNNYNIRNYDNVKDAINYIINNPKEYSPKVVKVFEEIKDKLDNPSSSMDILYAVDILKELGFSEANPPTKKETPTPKKPQPAAEPKKTTPKTSKTASEIKRVTDEIQFTEIKIEDFQEEIKNEKENLKGDIKEIRDKIAEVRKSPMSKAAKEDRIEELKAEIEDLQDNYEGYVEQYKNDIEDNRRDLKKLKRELAKLEETKKSEAVVEPTPAATKTETPQQDKATEKEVETLLEPIGKTPQERENQIFQFFALAAAGGDKTKAREIARVTNNLWENVAKQLGKRSKQAAEAWIQAKVALIGKTSVAGATGMGNAKFQEAQTYFTRNADRLPLTLAVFNRPEFKELVGKNVNPITVLNKLNQTGIKAAEKELIKGILEENFKGQSKISYDELEAVVRANIMPLERIFTSSYSSYGMSRLSGDYGEANTIILNAPIEHGFTGNHFPNAFKNSGRKDIKYIPKQLDANTWVAVEEGYETRGANANNIYQFVGTAGTKEAVNAWIDEYGSTNKNWTVFEDQSYKGRDLPSKKIKSFDTEEEANDFIDSNKERYEGSLDYIESEQVDDINKGMFGHIRTWVKDKIFTVAELQSDYFQNNNAKKSILEYDNIFNVARQKIYIEFQKYSKKLRDDAEEATTAELESIVRKLNSLKTYDKTKFTLVKGITAINYSYEGGDYGQYFITENTDYDDLYNEFSNRIFPNEKESVINEITTMFSPIFKINDKLEQDINAIRTRLEKDVDKKVTEIQNDKYNELTPQEKQFIASQKSWEQRMVREAIKEASLSGATKLRFPTPYTLSVIEGYISEDNKLPYRIKSSDTRDLKAGDTIEYLDKDHIVVASTDNTISVVQKDADITDLIIDDIRAEKDEEDFINKNKLSNRRKFYRGVMNYDGKPLFLDYSDTPYSGDQDPDFFKKYRKEIGDFLGQDLSGEETFEDYYYFTQSRKHTSVGNATKAINGDIPSIDYKPTAQDINKKAKEFDDTTPSGTAHIVGDRVYQGLKFNLKQPKEYGSTKKDTFSIGELSKTEQTVAYKYEEIAKILKQERGEDKVGVVTDENGFDWYETQVTPEDLNKPVVAFQADNANLSVQQAIDKISNNLIPEIDRLIKEMSNKDNIKKRGWTTAQAAEHVRELRAVKAQVEKNMKDPKFQENGIFRGATIELANSQFIIAALDTPNESTFIHEMSHVFSDDLLPEEKQTFIDEYNELFGEKEKGWSTDVSEYFARTWEKYLSNGRKLTSAEVKDKGRRETLQEVFDKFTDWLQGIYNGVIEYNNSKGVKKEITLSPAAQAIFDNINNIKTQTKDENKESSQSNGQGQRQDEKRGESQENEVRGQGQKGNVTTKSTESKLASDESKSNESNQDNKGQERQGEGQVGSTLAQEQGKGKGEEVISNPKKKSAAKLVKDPSSAADLSQDQINDILDLAAELGIAIPKFNKKCN